MNQDLYKWDRPSPLTLPPGLDGAGVIGQISCVPPSPQGNKMAGQNEFIDLKTLKNNAGTSVQPSEHGGEPVQSLGKPQLQQFRSLKGQGNGNFRLAGTFLQPQATQQTHFLPQPYIAASEEAKLQKPQTVQPSKTFTDGPLLPLSEEENADQFGIELRKEKAKAFGFQYDLKSDVGIPVSDFEQGTIRYTTTDALKKMVYNLSGLHSSKTTGCIVDETCAPEFDCYTKDIHFLEEQCLGSGSYGKVDLCFDSKTQKPFVRKQLPKKSLRSSEIIVPTTLNHCNITKFYGLIQRECQEEGNPTIELLIEYGGFALNKYFLEGNTLTNEQIWSAAKQGLAALVHIGHYSIVHLDVKPENICVKFEKDGSIMLKLTDFGSSRLPQEPLKFVGLTPEYLAPELCKMYFQSSMRGLNFGLTEADITGKVDVFAFGLVIMYLYKGYHILLKVINNGNTTYAGVGAQTRQIMHQKLMLQMADEQSAFVHNLIPDECDLDMRDLLTMMTKHRHQDRCSAKEAHDYIEVKELRYKLAHRTDLKAREVPDRRIQKQLPYVVDQNCRMETGIPGIAEDCMESENGPVKNKTKDALRLKLQPYGKKGKNCKAINENIISAQASVSEMNELRRGIASKQMPMTPVSLFQELSLGQSLPQKLLNEANTVSSMTERNGVLAQPSMEVADSPRQVRQLAEPVIGYSAVRHAQPEEPAQGFIAVGPSHGVEQAAGFTSIRPTMRETNPARDNVVSLGGRAMPCVGLQQSGYFRLDIPQELLQKLIAKKMLEQHAKAQQAKMVKPEPQEFPEVINIESGTPVVNEDHIGAIKNMKTFSNNPVQMEEGSEAGNMPKFSQFLCSD